MNRKQALKILGLREDDFTEDKLKKEYRAKILEFHPDKNKSPEASAKFIEIQEAYSILRNIDNAMESDEYVGESYNSLLKKFMSTIFREETDVPPLVVNIIEIVCKKICLMIEHRSEYIIEYLRNINRDTLKTIHSVLSKYRGIFHFSSDIFEKIEEILRGESNNNRDLKVDEYIVLNPTLEDMMSEENIYILKYLDQSYLVPLWQHEMDFDVSGQNLVVRSFPILPENMELDDCNVLTVRLQYNLRELWGREVIVEIGGKQFAICGNMLKMTGEPQKIEYYEVGVPYNNMKDVLDASQKQSIIFMVTVRNDI
jgi:hypothetical protein